ncbi:hypothetical protein ACFFYR_11370 [Paraburkholderia dipogonis]|uniref:hypothetical protein n=1 Tax=Paraburkholderia dipogonis TaxID=1211383 RepID=UPI001FCBE17E|nr:hypothetical protein [Paraburkholderia dipogonis]
MADSHAALEQQLFNVAQAQLKTEEPAHCLADNCRRKAVAVIDRFRFFHRGILVHRFANVTEPSPLATTCSPTEPAMVCTGTGGANAAIF